jgi:hypothetical protein
MMQLTVTTWAKSRLSSVGIALALASIGIACGSTDAANSPDSGDASDHTGRDGGSKGVDARSTSDAPTQGVDGGGITPQDADGLPDASGGEPDAQSTAPMGVALGAAGNFVILAKTGISTVPTSAVTGDIGVSPAAATYITGFSLMPKSPLVFSTSSQVTGRVYGSDYASPTPSNLTAAVNDMQLAFTDAAGRAAAVTELGAGNIGGMTLAPGVYKWSTGLLIPTDLTLSGSSTDLWIFEIAKNLTLSDATNVTLAGGALPQNVFWQVSGSVDIGTTAHVEGVVLAQTTVELKTGASINGRLLSQTAVNIDGSTVVEPSP